MALVVAWVVPPAPLWAQEAEPSFYHGYDFGSESTYNPASVLVNRGWDMMQLGDTHHDPWHFDYAGNASNVLDNLAHAPLRVGAEGWGRFLRQEIFPLSFSSATARWVPNYTLHLLGGGQTYAMLGEWYRAHGVPLPQLWSAVTLMSAALANESIENKGVHGRNTDCIADMLVFDIAGMLLFSAPAVRRFFSRELELLDWSPPPVLSWPNFELHNHGNYYAARWSLPFAKQLALFSYFGTWTSFGLSYKLPDGHSVSVAAGGASTKLIGSQPNLVENVVTFVPAVGVFIDRRGSLLASLKVADVPDYFVHAELFPGLVPRAKWLGAFAAFARNGHFVAGVTTTLGFGVGGRLGLMEGSGAVPAGVLARR